MSNEIQRNKIIDIPGWGTKLIPKPIDKDNAKEVDDIINSTPDILSKDDVGDCEPITDEVFVEILSRAMMNQAKMFRSFAIEHKKDTRETLWNMLHWSYIMMYDTDITMVPDLLNIMRVFVAQLPTWEENNGSSFLSTWWFIDTTTVLDYMLDMVEMTLNSHMRVPIKTRYTDSDIPDDIQEMIDKSQFAQLRDTLCRSMTEMRDITKRTGWYKSVSDDYDIYNRTLTVYRWAVDGLKKRKEVKGYGI